MLIRTRWTTGCNQHDSGCLNYIGSPAQGGVLPTFQGGGPYQPPAAYGYQSQAGPMAAVQAPVAAPAQVQAQANAKQGA